MPLNWNDSTVPGWQTMWQLTPVGIASADRSAHDINEGLREMARLSHSRTEGMLNRKAQKDAQKRQEKQQKSMFKRQVGTQVGLGLATAGLSAGIGAIAAPDVAAPAAATSQGVSSSLEPVMEGAGTLSSSSAPIAESASGGLSPIVGTADDMGIPSLVPSETGATYSLGDFAGQGGNGLMQDTAVAPIDPKMDKMLNPVSTGQMGTGVGGITNDAMMNGQHYGSAGRGDFWSRFGKNFGMNMLGQSPYWAMMGGR